ncbi:type I restriction enzyme HsdR N-terminal domain-containing protein [Candidatus Protochlamydia phocaeensis]|uniref:type I restriction enzyme HsdR N-terminal domain-containing protein n=1 Tax=Candidatus Protochlamydia phocaeensis TaxID=1414722 RepID=UPI0008395B68|nr:type I restriction enzyme HsdR N-terminal domain-containing protein [Candidatus Protochlamydia phocaeensis]
MPDQTTQLFCLLRKKWIAATPEEKIRQNFVLSLTQQLGYPLGCLAMEKSLSQMPHLQHLSQSSLPNRRTDIIVFAQGLHPHYAYYPLLLIECKAVPLNAKVMRQIVGYNRYLQAYFLALVNQNENLFGWYDADLNDFSFRAGVPPYVVLLQQAQSLLQPIPR